MSKNQKKENKQVSISFSLGQMNRMYTMLDVPLHGNEVRQRNKFIKIINPHVDAIGTKREEILQKYANKDENGKAKVVNGLYDIPVEKREDSLKELREYLTTEVEITLDSNTKSAILSILLNKTGQMKIEEGEIYDSILTKLEDAN